MHNTIIALPRIAALSLVCIAAYAELESVYVNGELRLRYNHFSVPRDSGNVVLMPGSNDTTFIEQRTRLGVQARFAADVSLYAEFDAYAIHGEDFRSDYLTGLDARANTFDDLEIYQAYLQLDRVYDERLSIRIGRQEHILGSEWLLGNNDTGPFFQGLSFDGVRVRWTESNWSLNAAWYRLAENSPIEEDADIDLIVADAAFAPSDALAIEAYWLYLRDGRGARLGFPFDTPNRPGPNSVTPIFDFIEDPIEAFFGVDQYPDTTAIHTLGVRVHGELGRWDYQAEAAYQHIDAANITRTFFRPDPASRLTGNSLLPFAGPYGEDDASFELFAADAEFGYTFRGKWSFRPFVGAAHFQGADRRADNFGHFIRNLFPFYEQRSSAAFNRMFSDRKYSDFIDDTELSNTTILRAGVEVQAHESLRGSIEAIHFQTEDRGHINGLFVFPFLSFPKRRDLGWELQSRIAYDYSSDLQIAGGYSHYFAAPGIQDGNAVRGNGLLALGGGSRSDADYFFIETRLKF